MGEQVNIADMARNLIRLSGFVPDDEIKIVFTGLRPGEKLFEELVGSDETAVDTSVEKVQRILSTTVLDDARFAAELRRLEDAAMRDEIAAVTDLLHQIVPTFAPAPTVLSEGGPLPYRTGA
jgi:FlaA1/EpsC-like NDP-sugar epimerase